MQENLHEDSKVLELTKQNDWLRSDLEDVRRKNKKLEEKLKTIYAIAVLIALVLVPAFFYIKEDIRDANDEISYLETEVEEAKAERNEFEDACYYFDEYVGFLQDELDAYGYWEELADVDATVSPSGEKSFVVYITESDDMFHKDGCQSLSESKYDMDIKDASYYGCRPCPLCYSAGNAPEDYTESSSESQSITVYVTNTGEKYHRDGCQYLSQSQIPMSLEDATSYGYEPCSKCY